MEVSMPQINVAICSGGARVTMKSSCLNVRVLDMRRTFQRSSQKLRIRIRPSNLKVARKAILKICQVGQICWDTCHVTCRWLSGDWESEIQIFSHRLSGCLVIWQLGHLVSVIINGKLAIQYSELLVLSDHACGEKIDAFFWVQQDWCLFLTCKVCLLSSTRLMSSTFHHYDQQAMNYGI